MTTRKFSKKFFQKKFRAEATQSMPTSETGGPCQYFFTFWIFTAQKTPFLRFFRFCTFLWSFSESRARYSDYVQKFIPFRTNPILYNNLYVFGNLISLYIGTGAGAGFCSDFVFILFILGNMIQKSLFVYYWRKKV